MYADTVFNIFGFIGAFLILLGFYRVSIGQWTNKSAWYELDNLIGACLLVAYQIHNKTYVTVILNVVWVIVAFHGLTSYANRRKSRAKRRAKRA